MFDNSAWVAGEPDVDMWIGEDSCELVVNYSHSDGRVLQHSTEFRLFANIIVKTDNGWEEWDHSDQVFPENIDELCEMLAEDIGGDSVKRDYHIAPMTEVIYLIDSTGSIHGPTQRQEVTDGWTNLDHSGGADYSALDNEVKARILDWSEHLISLTPRFNDLDEIAENLAHYTAA